MKNCRIGIVCFAVSIVCGMALAQPVLSAGIFTLPHNGNYQVNCAFGTSCYATHYGNDYPLPAGTQVVSAAEGVISIASDTNVPNDPDLSKPNNFGNYIKINHGTFGGNAYESIYGHLQTGSFLVKTGDRVYRGQTLAKSGNSGTATNYHLHLEVRRNNAPVDPYNVNDWLWTTNPPSRSYYSYTAFSFNAGSSEGMVPNWSMVEAPLGGTYGEWRVRVNGSDPGVDSPAYPAGLLAKNLAIEFSAKVVSGGNPVNEGRLYIKDESGSWNNFVNLRLINSEVGYNGGLFAPNDYNVYRADLAELARPDAEMRQFSIQLTGGYGTSETWTFDWIKVKVAGWDFKNDPIGWEIRQHGQTADFFVNEFWRIDPTGKQPQIASPENLNIPSFFTKIGLRYSVKTSSQETVRAYFDTGSGFSTSCYAAKSVAHNGNSQTVVFDLPACAVGKTKRLLFDLFDNTNYQGKQIAVNNISFLAEDVNNATYTVPTYSVFLSSASGASGSIPPPTPTWSVFSHFMTPSVSSSYPYGPGEAVYSYPFKFGQYPNYWANIKSANPGLLIAFRLYYVFDNIQMCEARQLNCSSGYLGEFYAYYDAAAQEYRAWHRIQGNSLPYIGPYRAELWINGQKSAECLFDLTLEPPSTFTFNGPVTATSIPLFWSILGSIVPGSGVELFRDGQPLAFIPGTSNGYTDTNLIPGVQHVYQIREVQVHPAGTFRSPFSKSLILNMAPAAPKALRIVN